MQKTDNHRDPQIVTPARLVAEEQYQNFHYRIGRYRLKDSYIFVYGLLVAALGGLGIWLILANL